MRRFDWTGLFSSCKNLRRKLIWSLWKQKKNTHSCVWWLLRLLSAKWLICNTFLYSDSSRFSTCCHTARVYECVYLHVCTLVCTSSNTCTNAWNTLHCFPRMNMLLFEVGGFEISRCVWCFWILTRVISANTRKRRQFCFRSNFS